LLGIDMEVSDATVWVHTMFETCEGCQVPHNFILFSERPHSTAGVIGFFPKRTN
jgi:hypothetical protein